MTIEKGHLIWSEVEEKLNEMNNKIFEGVDKSILSDYEKRKMIFEYLCNNLKYDFDGLIDLYLNSKKMLINFDEIAKHEPMTQYYEVKELLSTLNIPVTEILIFQVISRIEAKEYEKGLSNCVSIIKIFEEGKGMCNSDSIVYKMLLEMNDIYSAVFICDNSQPRLHALNLVYDKEHNSYSFDDVSTYTAARETENVTPDMFFDYDLEYANNILKQGFTPSIPSNSILFVVDGKTLENRKVFYRYDPSLINYQLNRTNNVWHEQFELEKDGNITIPNNIVSLKNNNKRL